MVKSELITAIQEKMPEGTPKTIIDEFLAAFTESVEEAVANNNPVKLIGFGTFERKEVKGREGVCQVPTAKGQKWKTEDSFKVVFKPGVEFSNRVKGV